MQNETLFHYRKSRRQVAYNLLTMAIVAPAVIHLILTYVVPEADKDLYNTIMPAFILVSLILIGIALFNFKNNATFSFTITNTHVTSTYPGKVENWTYHIAIPEIERLEIYTSVSDKPLPDHFIVNESIDLNIIVTNAGVGHDFPGGSIDINQAWLALSVFDAQGRMVFQSGDIRNKRVDPEAYFYRAIPIDKKGNQVWRHDLFNMTGETTRNVIPAGKSDIVKYNFAIPGWVKGPLTINAVLKYRKFNQAYAEWALKDDYRDIPIIDMARHSLIVPIREQPLAR